MKTVADLLKVKGNNVWSTTPESTVLHALQLMAEKNVGALLVLDPQDLAGIFSERDYARRTAQGMLPMDTAVREVMTRTVLTISAEQTIDKCMEMMTESHIRHLPVMEGGKLIGLISIGDVVKSIISDQEFTINRLHEYISGKW